MEKLTKRDLARRDEIKSSLESAYEIMRAEFENIEGAVSRYNVAVANYNEVLGEASGFKDDLANELDSFISDKSEKWQDGERGQAFNSWKEEIEGTDFSEVDPLDISEFIPAEECEAVETLINIPEEPSF